MAALLDAKHSIDEVLLQSDLSSQPENNFILRDNFVIQNTAPSFRATCMVLTSSTLQYIRSHQPHTLQVNDILSTTFNQPHYSQNR